MALTDIELLRIYIGDASEPYIFSDEELQAFLDLNDNDIQKTADILRPYVGLRMASEFTREREGNVEIYGGDKAKNYLEYLKHFNDEQLSSAGKLLASHYIGGTSKTFNDAIDNNTDIVGPGIQVGMFSGNTMGLFDI